MVDEFAFGDLDSSYERDLDRVTLSHDEFEEFFISLSVSLGNACAGRRTDDRIFPGILSARVNADIEIPWELTNRKIPIIGYQILRPG